MLIGSAVVTSANALTLSYARLPMQIGTAITPLTPSLGGAVGGTTYAVTAGTLPPGLSLNPATGNIAGTPTATGTSNVRITATNGATTASVDLIMIVYGGPAGPTADRPVYQYETNGVASSPWGAGFYSWPKQLFWQNVEELATSALGEMRYAAASIEAEHRVPVIGSVGWGYEYYVATGDPDPGNSGFENWSSRGGWGQWGQFMKSHPQYRSTDHNGVAEPGYFTPMMPMDPADWPADWTSPAGWIAPAGWVNGKPTTTVPYAQWLGIRIAQLGLFVGARGIYAADYVVGLEWGDLVDFNQRVIDDFSRWANVTVPSGTIAAQATYIGAHLKPLYNDLRASRFAQFYGTIAQNLHDNGKVPMVGGQLPADPAVGRCFGDDTRWFIHSPDGVSASYYFFNLELQADALRTTSGFWDSSIHAGATASWEPDMPLGTVMDALGGDGSFETALANAGHDAAWAAKHVRQQWLSVGWAHIAGRDGTIRRATRAFTRSYWDVGTPPAEEVALIFGHIPRHPFGPAFYYSSAIMRSFEVGNGAGNWNPFWRLIREIEPLYNSDSNIGRAAGLCTGYYVSDVGFQNLKPADYPSAWIVFDSDRLPAAEKAALSSIAPVYDIESSGADQSGAAAAALLAAGPVRVTQPVGQGLNCSAFIDQNDSVIVMVSNAHDSAATGRLAFNSVGNGTFQCNGLLNSSDTTLNVAGNVGSFPISVPGRETIVYEIPQLKWVGHDPAAVAVPKPGAPSITSQPAATTVVEGGVSFTLSVGATGSGLQYQWYKDGSAVGANGTSAVYSVPAAAAIHAGTYTVIVSNSAGFVASADAVVQVGRPATGYELWQNLHFPGGGTDPSSDPDGDGFINREEYVYGLDPNVKNPRSAAPQIVLATYADEQALTVTFTRNTLATDAVPVVEVSSDLVTWTSDTGATAVVSSTDLGNEVWKLVVRDQTTVHGAARRFMRVRIVQKP